MAEEVRILVIDDNRESCQIITDILESSGYLVEVAHDGETGLNKVKFSIQQETPYQLCITDVMLPKVSGIDILKQVKQISIDIGVIVISAFDEVDPFLKKEAVNYGAFRFLPKPIPPGKLLASVKEYLSTLKIHKGGSSESTRAKIPFFGTTKKHTQRIDRQSMAHPTPPPETAGFLPDGPVPAGLEHLGDGTAPPPPPDEQDHITRPVPDAEHFQDIKDASEAVGSAEHKFKIVKCPMCSKLVKIANDGSHAKIWCSSCGILFDREDAEEVPFAGEGQRSITVPEPSTYQNPFETPDTSPVHNTPPPPPIPSASRSSIQPTPPPVPAIPSEPDPMITTRTPVGAYDASDEEEDDDGNEYDLPPSRGSLQAADEDDSALDPVEAEPAALPEADGVFRLLLVEDDPHAGEILQTALDVAGYSSEIAESGSDAYAMIEEGFAQGTPYTLVISDVMIPGMNGLDLMKKVRSQFQNIDFILVSAYEDENLSLQKQAEMEGALTFFSKPYDYKQMVKFISQHKEAK